MYILGIVGDIFFKRADLGVAPLTLNPSRAAYIGHLQPIGNTNGCLVIDIYKKPNCIKVARYFSFFHTLWQTVVNLGPTWPSDVCVAKT